MPSFQISVPPNRRAAARFVEGVRRSIQKALAEENLRTGLTQSDIARTIGVHRSVINREIRGFKDITLGRVAELAHALGRVPQFDLAKPAQSAGSNLAPSAVFGAAVVTVTVNSTATIQTLAPTNWQSDARTA